MANKIILVIGATGAQGTAVIKALLAPADDGSPSPYAVRALTRDPTSRRAKELSDFGVELVQGAFDDFTSVEKALDGAYGAYVNTDGFTVGEAKEVYSGIAIYEIAQRTPSLRHFVYSGLDYVSKKGGFQKQYKSMHYDGKGRVGEFLRAQPSDASLEGKAWSIITSGPYMDMLNIHTFGPLNKREDGTFVFAAPVGDGHVPMVALADIGFWARYTFDHRTEASGKDFEIASDRVTWDELVATFTRVTGQPAVHKRQTLDEWWGNFDNVDKPLAKDLRDVPGAPTVRDNFSGFWSLYRDDVLKRDMDWIRSVHPKTHNLESWMRDTGYTGRMNPALLKGFEAAGTSSFSVNREVTGKL